MELSTNAIPNVSDSSSSVTLEQVKNMLADWDVYLVINWLSSREREATGKQPEITNDPPPTVTTAVTSDVPISQPSATLPVSLWQNRPN
jgi:hypothetical protein